MMKKEKTLRMAVTGALLLTVVAAGISMYRTDTTPKKESKAQQEEESKDVTSKDAEAQDTGELAKNTTENQEATPSPTMNQDNPDNAIRHRKTKMDRKPQMPGNLPIHPQLCSRN